MHSSAGEVATFAARDRFWPISERWWTAAILNFNHVIHFGQSPCRISKGNAAHLQDSGAIILPDLETLTYKQGKAGTSLRRKDYEKLKHNTKYNNANKYLKR
eukprot:gene15758-17347_t